MEYAFIKTIIVVGKDAKKGFDSMGGIEKEIHFVTSTSGGNAHWEKQKHEWYDLNLQKK